MLRRRARQCESQVRVLLSLASANRVSLPDLVERVQIVETPVMKALEVVGYIDDRHVLHANLTTEWPIGRVRVIVLISEEGDAGTTDLEDPRRDLYTLEDGAALRGHLRDGSEGEP